MGLKLLAKKKLIKYEDGTDDIAITGDLTVTGSQTVTGAQTFTGAATFTAGAQSGAAARTATADGLTTGIIAPGTRFVAVTSANAAHIVTLPAAVVGNIIDAWVGATGHEIRTPAASGATINAVDADGTQQAAIPATTHWRATCVAANTWILVAWDELGAAIAAIVPDAP